MSMTQTSARAVVFGYHTVGVRCIKTLLARGIKIELVVTHEDNPNETIWFESVANLCAEHGIPTITPSDAKSPELHAQIAAIAPDFIFSFYYRNMLPVELLALAKKALTTCTAPYCRSIVDACRSIGQCCMVKPKRAQLCMK